MFNICMVAEECNVDTSLYTYMKCCLSAVSTVTI